MFARLPPSTAARRQPVGASPPLLLVEQGYGVRDAGDEPAHAGKQQQFLDKPGHDVPPGVAPGETTTGSGNLGSNDGARNAVGLFHVVVVSGVLPALPGAHVLWAVCAGRSVRNLWRTHVF